MSTHIFSPPLLSETGRWDDGAPTFAPALQFCPTFGWLTKWSTRQEPDSDVFDSPEQSEDYRDVFASGARREAGSAIWFAPRR